MKRYSSLSLVRPIGTRGLGGKGTMETMDHPLGFNTTGPEPADRRNRILTIFIFGMIDQMGMLMNRMSSVMADHTRMTPTQMSRMSRMMGQLSNLFEKLAKIMGSGTMASEQDTEMNQMAGRITDLMKQMSQFQPGNATQ